jgi:hypothetical protein
MAEAIGAPPRRPTRRFYRARVSLTVNGDALTFTSLRSSL